MSDRIVYVVAEGRSYGFWSFVGDVIMFFLTFGLWLIWLFGIDVVG